MPEAKGPSLTAGALEGLTCMQHYRFLTIPQFARITKVSYVYATRVLREMEQRRVVGYFGYTSIPGQGKTPKVYFLTRRCYEWLVNESNLPAEIIGPFHDLHREFSWTPQMYHRLRILDCFIAIERAVRDLEHLELIDTKLEYRRSKGNWERETADHVDDREVAENRIVPDGAFVLGNRQTGRRGLFLLEMDMGTERITVRSSSDKRAIIRGKFEQYDRHLRSGRFVAKYASAGEFGFFTLLFVTLTWDRIENIRAAVSNMQQDLHAYYRLTTLNAAVDDFVGSIWKSRDARDNLTYALVQQP